MNLDKAEQFRKDKRAELEKSGQPTSDGCTFAPELGTPCCEMHDYLRRFLPDGITPRVADKLFRQCLQKKGHPILAWVYWCVVRVGNLIGIYG
jgi:hypothetical protein